MEFVERGIVLFADTVWSYLLYLLIGGGLFLLLYSRFMPLRHFKHSIEIIRGKYDDPNEPGDITHFQALVSALAATIGMGNISGVAVAIAVGGPGAMFWMWVSALVGIATKFFTCSLAIMYRGKDSAGKTQGGPMYVVQEGLGRNWKPLAIFFAVVAVIGCLPLFQVNQLVQIMRDVIFVPMGVVGEDHFWFDLTAGVVLVLLVGTVIFGGITRIADVASRVVPAMVILYMFCALWIIVANFTGCPAVPHADRHRRLLRRSRGGRRRGRGDHDRRAPRRLLERSGHRHRISRPRSDEDPGTDARGPGGHAGARHRHDDRVYLHGPRDHDDRGMADDFRQRRDADSQRLRIRHAGLRFLHADRVRAFLQHQHHIHLFLLRNEVPRFPDRGPVAVSVQLLLRRLHHRRLGRFAGFRHQHDRRRVRPDGHPHHAFGPAPVTQGNGGDTGLPATLSTGIRRGKTSMTWPVLHHYDQDHLARIALPLGGIGTGTVSLGGRGDLRDWELMNRPAKGFIPGRDTRCPPSFTLYARSEGGDAVARLLEGPLEYFEYEGASGSPAANHGLPRFARCSFDAAYPFGRVHLTDDDVPVDVRLEAFNPLIPCDADRSGLPVALLRYVLTNRTDVAVSAAVCGSIPNFIGMDGTDGACSENRNRYRAGDGYRGLFMASKGVDREAAQWGTMALATTAETVSYRTAWRQAGWGTPLLDFWDEFSAGGVLTDREAGNNDRPMASLSARVDLAPGETSSVTFVLAWHFPNRYTWTPATKEDLTVGGDTETAEEDDCCDDADDCCDDDSDCCDDDSDCCDGGKVCCDTGDRIGNYYTTRFEDAWDVVEQVIPDLCSLEADTLRFVEAFSGSDLPEVVKEAALFNLSTLRSQTCFRTPDGRFYGWEGCHDAAGCCLGSCTHVWNYEQSTAFLFGDLAQTMREVEFAHATDENGLMSFRVWLPLARARNFNRAAADGQMGCVMKMYREWQLSGDDERLRALWPDVKKSLAFCWIPGGWDGDRDGVMEGCQHNTMDVEYFGPNPQMEFWYLGALRAAEEMGRYLGDDDFGREMPGPVRTRKRVDRRASLQRRLLRTRDPAAAKRGRHRGRTDRRHGAERPVEPRLPARFGVPGGSARRPVHGPCQRPGIPGGLRQGPQVAREHPEVQQAGGFPGPHERHAILRPRRRVGSAHGVLSEGPTRQPLLLLHRGHDRFRIHRGHRHDLRRHGRRGPAPASRTSATGTTVGGAIPSTRPNAAITTPGPWPPGPPISP